MNNRKIRIAMLETGLRQWELAKLLETSEATLSRKMREEIPEAEQDRIVELIEKSMEEK